MSSSSATTQTDPLARVGIILFALAMGGFTIGTTEFASMSLLPYFAAELGVDEPMAGHAISAYALGVVVGAPVITVLAARIARRTLLLWLMGMFCIFNLLSAYSPNYYALLLFRFMCGLPHGAYFGVGALVAASLVPQKKRAQAIARMMLGLTVATIIGVPMATFIGQGIGWRYGFVIVGGLSLLTVALLWRYAPHDVPAKDASPLQELAALKNHKIWLCLALGAIGGGGLFAIYTYVASTLLEVTQVSDAYVPLSLAVFGVGLTFGMLIAAWAADRKLMPTMGGLLLWCIFWMAIYPSSTGAFWSLTLMLFIIGLGCGLAMPLQTRLMDVAGKAQAMAAALNHSAFNTANALGPLLGGMAINAGYGFSSTGYVGSALCVVGLLIWAIMVWDDKRTGTHRRKKPPLKMEEPEFPVR